MNKILFISSEAFPLIKTGGLADVAGSLPRALHKLQQDVRLMLPGYRQVLSGLRQQKELAPLYYYGHQGRLLESRLPGTQLTVLVVDCPALYDRDGGPYVDDLGQSWPDNPRRFAYFCLAARDVSLGHIDSGWQPDIVHCNDWQTALIPALLSLHDKHPVSIFTIHNLAYQGMYDASVFQELALPAELWHMGGLEFYGKLSMIKGGLAYADKITAVSPTYAEEIQHPANGYGLDGLLQFRQKDLVGILNGIDTRYWNPGTDEYLPVKYNRRTLPKKSENKTALQAELQLTVDANLPMIGMVSRLVEQKGLNWIIDALPEILAQDCQIIMLGSGEAYYQDRLLEISQAYPQQFRVIIGYDEALSHRIEAACDIYMMPSLFEPCGLNQLYSLRYGTIPVVNPVGGLADTIVDTTPSSLQEHTANGFHMRDASARGLVDGLNRALEYFQQPDIWRQLQLTAMSCDYSWQASAEQYLQLYAQISGKGV